MASSSSQANAARSVLAIASTVRESVSFPDEPAYNWTMEAAIGGVRTAGIDRRGPRLDVRAFGSWLLGAALVVYLGLRGGGYDPLVRGEIGIAVWWIVLIGAAVGVLPIVRLHRSAWIAI